MRLKKNLFNLIFVFTSLLLHGQNNTSEPQLPFSNGEVLNFDIQYNFGSMWLNVGTLQLLTDTIINNGLKYYNFRSESKTIESWKWLYEVSSSYDVVSSQTTLKPLKYSQSTKYGNHLCNYSYFFDDDSIHLSIIRDKEFIEKSIKNDSLIFDGLSAIYYARTIDFCQLSKGDTIELDILHDDKLLKQKIIFEGIVDLNIKKNEISECFKFSSIIENNSIISNKVPAQVWVTTDCKRLPLRINVEIIVGSVNIYLSN